MLNLNQLYVGFFILCVVLGSKAEDILNLLRGDSDTSLGFKNGVLTVRISDKPFAKKINSNFLAKSNETLKFSLPAILSMLISRMKIDFETSVDMDNEAFLSGYEDFIKESAKRFPKKITIKPKHVYRYLAQYVHDMDDDALTALLATTMVFRNNNAKTGYVSARSNSEVQAQLLSQYCIDLGLDSVISSLLGIPNVFQTSVSTTSPHSFTGSSKVVDADKARAFFRALRINILKHSDDRVLHFNLVSIYIRYAASLLLGARSFNQSFNFNSYSSDLGLWYISEKSQDIASGVRVVPVCNIMNSLFEYYEKVLKERGLKHNVYFIDAEEIIPFSDREAFQVIYNAPFLYDQENLEEYIKEVPLNSGRHLFTCKAIDYSISSSYISAYMGHYSAGEEQFGLYSTLNISDYCDSITYITTIIANEFGIKELT